MNHDDELFHRAVAQWRERDGHVVMTGPAEWEFSGRLDPATGAWQPDGEPDAAEEAGAAR